MESLVITASDKAGIYEEIIPQIENILEGENDIVANTANVAAILKEAFNFFWVGFYFVKNEELVLGPFQGPLACTRIKYGKGVCGTAWKEGKTLVVPDVDKFPGHIACSSLSRSEIVVPVFKASGNIVAVLDIDSKDFNTFDSTDAKYLEQLCRILGALFSTQS